MSEATFTRRRVIPALEARGAFVFKVHGSGYQKKGLPDVVGCYRGCFFGFESKKPGEKPEPMQFHRLAQIQKAGGFAGWGTTVAEALALLDAIDQHLDGRPAA